jgi:hypothetical protein
MLKAKAEPLDLGPSGESAAVGRAGPMDEGPMGAFAKRTEIPATMPE